MTSIIFLKAVIKASVPDKNDRSILNRYVDEAPSDAEAIAKVDNYLGKTGVNSIFAQSTIATNPPQTASDAIVSSAGGSVSASIPTNYFSNTDGVNILDAEIGTVTALNTNSKVIVPAINEVIAYVNELAGISRSDTVEAALSDINTSVGNNPLIVSDSYDHSLTSGVNVLKLQTGTVTLNSNSNKDDVSSFFNIITHLETLLGNSDNYATSEALATTIVNGITITENVTPSVTIAELKADIDATVTSGRTLSQIVAGGGGILANLITASSAPSASSIKNAIYATNAIHIPGSGSNPTDLQTDITSARNAGNIVTLSSATGNSDISGIKDNTGTLLSPVTLSKGLLTVDGKVSDITPLQHLGANVVKDKAGTDTATGATLPTIIANVDGKVSDISVLTGTGGFVVKDNTGTAVTAGSSLPTIIHALDGKVDDTHTFTVTNAAGTSQANQPVVTAVNALDGKVGVLTGLTTTAKDTLVNSINELKTSTGTPLTFLYPYDGFYGYLGNAGFYGSSSGTTITALVGTGSLSNYSPSTITGAIGNVALTGVTPLGATAPTTLSQGLGTLTTAIGTSGLTGVTPLGATAPTTLQGGLTTLTTAIGTSSLSNLGGSVTAAIGNVAYNDPLNWYQK